MPRRTKAATIQPDQDEKPRVFLSHNAKDGDAAELIRKVLVEARLEPFLYQRDIPPGARWLKQLARALTESEAFVLLLGPSGMGWWQERELEIAFNRESRQPEYRIVPVLFPGSSLPEIGTLPVFLHGLTWVDLRNDLSDPEALQRLVSVLKGVSPGPSPAPIPTDRCPYRGLAAFREEDHPFFCGRGAVIQQILEGFRKGRSLLTVLGGSGSGKSSLLRAGLIPALRSGTSLDSKTWTILTLQPGSHPIAELAAQLERSWKLKSKPWEELLRAPAPRRRNLQRRISSCLQSAGSGRLILVIDQFEELFTLCTAEERTSFVDLLFDAAPVTGKKVAVVLALRNDFYGRAAEHARLAERLTECAIPIPPMTLRELRQAIEAPAKLVGLQLEKGLVEELMQDMERQPEALPLLEHALLELYERRRKQKAGTAILTMSSYREIGGIGGAIGQRADKVFSEMSEDEQRIARQVFLQLVKPGEGTANVRRPAFPSELPRGNFVQPVIKRLVDARLLTRRRNAKRDEVVDLIHEALVREWPLLRGWLEENREALVEREDLRRSALKWKKLDFPETALLQGESLASAVRWLGNRPDLLDDCEQSFLEKSRDLKKRDDEKRDLEARRRKEEEQRHTEEIKGHLKKKTRLVRWLRWITAGLVLFLIVALVMALFFGVTRREAKRQERLARARELAAKSALRADSPLLSLLLAVEAANFEPGALSTQDALRGALAQIEGEGLPGLPRDLLRPSLSRNGRRFAAFTGGDTVEVWSLEGETARKTQRVRTPRPIQALALSEDGTWLAVGDTDRVSVHDLSMPGAPAVRSWGLPSGSGLFDLIVTRDGRRFAAGGPDGLILAGPEGVSAPILSSTILCMALDTQDRWVAAGGQDGLLYLADLNASDPAASLRIWRGRSVDVVDVAFSPEGSLLAASGKDGTVQLWDLAAETELRVVRSLSGPAGSAADIALSPDGRYLATGGGDGKVFLWDLGGNAETRPHILRGHETALAALAFVAGERALVSVAVGGTGRRWNLSRLGVVHPWKLAEAATGQSSWLERGWRDSGRTGVRLYRGGLSSTVGHVVFDPARPWLLAGLGADTAALWRLRFPVPSSRPLGQPGIAVEAAAFSPRGSWIAWGLRDGRVFLRSLDGRFQQPLTRYGGPVTSLSFSPDGRWLASGGTDGRIRLWHPDRIALAAGEVEPVPGLPVRSIEISPDNRWLAVTHDGEGSLGNLNLWRLDTDRPEASPRTLSRSSLPLAAALFTPDARWLITADHAGQGCLWDLDSQAEEPPCRPLPTGRVTGLSVSPDGHWLATGSGRSLTMHLWDLRADSPEASPMVLQGGGGPIQVVAFSPGSRWLATGTDAAGGHRGSIRLWDLHAGDPSQDPWSLSSSIEGVSALAFGPRDRWLAAGGSNRGYDRGELSLWDLAAGDPGGDTPRIALEGHTDRITTVAFSADGRFLASADLANAARLWALSLDDLTDLACRAAGRELTAEELEQYFPGESRQSVCARRTSGRHR